MIDLDHFKQVNDTWGHQAGDVALQVCARTLKDYCRDTDIAARLGGEEFTLLIKGGHAQAELVANRIRHAIASTPIVIDEASRFELTASIGVATLQPNETLEHLLQRADLALYDAKQQGRDRVEAARH